MQVAIDQIEPNPLQPRNTFQPDRLRELAQSIEANGVLQPLIVRANGDKYELVAGERRWRASKLAGLDKVPVILQDVARDRMLELALIENIQREDLNPMEVAQAFDRLIREHGLNHEELGRRTGKDRATISHMLRLLRLPPDIQLLVAEQRLSMGHAKALLGLDTPEAQREAAERCAAQGLSVRQCERMVQRMLEPRQEAPAETPIDPNVKAAIQELERALGTRVRIMERNDQRGKIEIEYYSQDDLQRIYTTIVGESA